MSSTCQVFDPPDRVQPADPPAPPAPTADPADPQEDPQAPADPPEPVTGAGSWKTSWIKTWPFQDLTESDII